MSAPAGLWIVCDLKVEGSAGCAMAMCAEIRAIEIGSRAVRVILERSFIDISSSVVGVSITIRVLASAISGGLDSFPDKSLC